MLLALYVVIDLYSGDGKDNSYRGIPYYQNRLNDFASGFANMFNTQHSMGYTLEGGKGGDFFAIPDDENPAATVTVSKDILDNLNNIAAGGKSGDAEDNGNLLELLRLRDTGKLLDEDGNPISQGTPDDFLKSIISNLAVDSMQGKRMDSSQTVILKNIQSRRDSISGVSYDEEMSDMVRFQHAYIASARMITTMDTIMDVTINRLGLVGR